MLDAFYRRRQALEVSCTERPWCMDASVTPGTGRGAGVSGAGAMNPLPRLGSGNADEDWASQLQHAVQSMDGDVQLGRATLVRARAQPVADQLFEPADGGLGAGTGVVS